MKQLKQYLFSIRKQEMEDKNEHLRYLRSSSCPLTGVDKCNEIAKHNKSILELSESLNHTTGEVTPEYWSQLKGNALIIVVAFLVGVVLILSFT